MIAEKELTQATEMICPDCQGSCKAPYGDPFAEPGDPIYDDCPRCKGVGRIEASAVRPPFDFNTPPLGSFLNPRKYTDAFGNITFQAGATGITLRVNAAGDVEILVDEMYGEGESRPIIVAAVSAGELADARDAACYTEHEARELETEPVEDCPASGGKCRKCNGTGIAPVIDPHGGDSGMGDRCDCLDR